MYVADTFSIVQISLVGGSVLTQIWWTNLPIIQVKSKFLVNFEIMKNSGDSHAKEPWMKTWKWEGPPLNTRVTVTCSSGWYYV